MRTLTERVNASVGPPRAVHTHALATDMMKRALQLVLDRVSVCLTLPAGEMHPVIGDDQLQSLRHCIRVECFSHPLLACANRDSLARSSGLRLDRHTGGSGACFCLRSAARRSALRSLAARPMSPPRPAASAATW